MKTEGLELKDLGEKLQVHKNLKTKETLTMNKNNKQALIWASLSCLCFGLANFLIGIITSDIGIASLYPQFVCYFIAWFIYHSLTSV